MLCDETGRSAGRLAGHAAVVGELVPGSPFRRTENRQSSVPLPDNVRERTRVTSRGKNNTATRPSLLGVIHRPSFAGSTAYRGLLPTNGNVSMPHRVSQRLRSRNESRPMVIPSCPARG